MNTTRTATEKGADRRVGWGGVKEMFPTQQRIGWREDDERACATDAWSSGAFEGGPAQHRRRARDGGMLSGPAPLGSHDVRESLSSQRRLLSHLPTEEVGGSARYARGPCLCLGLKVECNKWSNSALSRSVEGGSIGTAKVEAACHSQPRKISAPPQQCLPRRL